MDLRDYQHKAVTEIDQAWQSHQNVLYVLPCRGGKTPVVAHKILNNVGWTVAIAHRSELVGQMSRTLARNGVRHRIIGSLTTQRACAESHLKLFGRSYVDMNATCIVASVDTLIRVPDDEPWLQLVTLWVTDEAHHLILDNKWGKCVAKFPNARGLGVTATPSRADGKGLGRHADGVMDHMIIGPLMNRLSAEGHLAPYRIFAPPSDLDLSGVDVTASGDFSPDPLRKAVHKSHIIGDTVEHYLKIIPGGLGLTFCVDVESATLQAAAFRAAGVPAEVLSAKTPAAARDKIQQRHQRGELKQIVNVDLFGEGVDIPNLDCISMCRPTASFPLFYQQFCRPLNPVEGKTGYIIDHVGNVHNHSAQWIECVANGNWTLDRRENRGRSKVVQMVATRTCTTCFGVYERALGLSCPYCGDQVAVANRTAPAAVDGNLYELSPEALAQLRGETESLHSGPAIPRNATPEVIGALHKHHRNRLEALDSLKHSMAVWAAGKTDIPKAQREFYITFGIDVATAQTLSRKDAEALQARIERK